MRTLPLWIAAAALALTMVLCSPGQGSFQLRSAAFTANAAIPVAYSCDGQNASPALSWQGVPATARSLALIVDDPDAPGGVFTHWILYDLPPAARTLPAHLAAATRLPNGALQGQNSFGQFGYGGPCPPPGAPHHYVFTLYAVTVPSLGLAPGAPRDAVQSALAGKVAGQATLTATFARQ